MKQIKYILLAIVAFVVSSTQLLAAPSSAEAKAKQAEQHYAEGQFEIALDLYKQIVATGESAEIYYNMGNCYYRLDSIPQALLWYERAYLLNPGDPDIRHNLLYTRTKTIDKLVPEEEIFFVRWYRSLLNTFSAEGWTVAGIICFILTLSALCMFFFLSSLALRKLGFYGAIIMFVMVLLSNLFAWQQQDRRQNHDRAIIFETAISGKSSPNRAGKELFLLHEGTCVQIIDRTVRNWYQVQLPDGKRGWIPSNSVETI